MNFTTMAWKIQLDKKNRLVLPLKARASLNITDSILLKLENGKLVLTKANGENGSLSSRNCEEVSNF